MKLIRLFAVFLLTQCFAEAPLKVLHLSFHSGCIKEFSSVAKHLGLDLTTWHIPALDPYFFDGYAKGNALYNIGHERAKKIWDLHQDFFESFDVIFTSDTAPLSRIFIQNQCKVPLVVWICDRFDYYDSATLDCDFPDQEYYDLFNLASHSPNITIIANCAFEHFYATTKGVDSGTLVIKPAGLVELSEDSSPSSENREETLYLPPYHNETNFMDLSKFLTKLGLNNYCGRHNGLSDLRCYAAIVHLPYSYSTIALFENITLGIPYYIPSRKFLKQLQMGNNYWHQSSSFLFKQNLYKLSEWYNEENKDLFIYFDSWKDLAKKVKRGASRKKREQIQVFGKKLQEKTLADWSKVFEKIKAAKQ